MALPAFATVDDLDVRLPGGVGDDRARAQAVIDDASSLIRACAGVPWADDDDELDYGDLAVWRQQEIVRITIAAATRAFTNPERASEMRLGDAAISLADASSDVYLTAAEKASIRSMVGTSGGVPGLASIRVEAPAYASGTRYGDFDQIDESDSGS